ncbi:MAG: hypothetical protein ACKO7W_16550 [Elainella sp.]
MQDQALSRSLQPRGEARQPLADLLTELLKLSGEPVREDEFHGSLRL